MILSELARWGSVAQKMRVARNSFYLFMQVDLEQSSFASWHDNQWKIHTPLPVHAVH